MTFNHISRTTVYTILELSSPIANEKSGEPLRLTGDTIAKIINAHNYADEANTAEAAKDCEKYIEEIVGTEYLNSVLDILN